jgi:LacI family transcriptional regulator
VANINDVAKRAGVSPSTAKRAIRSPELLAKETLERVQRAIEELQYEPDRLASALRSGQSRTVGLIIGSIVEPFFAELTRTIGRELRQQGYTLLVADNEYDAQLEREQLKEFMGHRVAGLIIRSAFGKPNLDYLKRMQRRGTAIIEVDYFHPDSPFSHVMLDNRACVDAGVDYLVDLGHRRIACLGVYHPTIQPDERVQSFPVAMARHGLSVPEAYRFVIPPTEVAAYRVTRELMQLDEPPTAIFSVTGAMAVGAFRALKELKLRMPDEVSLLTFDNYPWTSLVEPPIDVIAQPVQEMGTAAVKLLLELMRAAAPYVVRQRFGGTLIRRGSCAPPRTPI